MIFDFLKKTNRRIDPKKPRILVAMSGGVDSSVTLATLIKQGYDCVAVHMNLWREPPADGSECVAVKDLISARQTANDFGVPFYVVNFEKPFKKQVVDRFLFDYKSGITPNPCAICNREIKFGLLLEKMKALGCSKLATGHYARIFEKNGIYELWSGIDKTRDQSYFLYHLTQEKLKYILFPLGNQAKIETKKQAKEFSLDKVMERDESRGACFYREKDDGPFLKRHLNAAELKSGKIVMASGEKIGEHQGLPLYTIGQREGIGIGGLAEPYYVIGKNIETNELIVGMDKDAWQKGFILQDLSWIAGESPKFPCESLVRIRYQGQLCECEISGISNDEISVKFMKKQRAVTPGQVAVFYKEINDGDLMVFGGGVIKANNTIK
ncbi:MAG: tRNA 2-thiouridine(34) synthase MnmA [Patescibacteria group bacterium]|nr:tRNA 2-thiouridine(34) synthase MnmA [Patescibacteria group bacterium]